MMMMKIMMKMTHAAWLERKVGFNKQNVPPRKQSYDDEGGDEGVEHDYDDDDDDDDDDRYSPIGKAGRV